MKSQWTRLRLCNTIPDADTWNPLGIEELLNIWSSKSINRFLSSVQWNFKYMLIGRRAHPCLKFSAQVLRGWCHCTVHFHDHVTHYLHSVEYFPASASQSGRPLPASISLTSSGRIWSQWVLCKEETGTQDGKSHVKHVTYACLRQKQRRGLSKASSPLTLQKWSSSRTCYLVKLCCKVKEIDIISMQKASYLEVPRIQ
jgi:hypothetical protein